jgi:hypothetical protein
MYVEASIYSGIWEEDIDTGGKFFDEAIAMFNDGTMLRLIELTAVRVCFFPKALKVFIYCLGFWQFVLSYCTGG